MPSEGKMPPVASGCGHGSHCRRCRSGAAIGAAGGRQDASGSGDPAPGDPGRLEDRLTHFGKPKLLIVDELAYLPFEPNAAHLFFQLVSRRYERGGMLMK